MQAEVQELALVRPCDRISHGDNCPGHWVTCVPCGFEAEFANHPWARSVAQDHEQHKEVSR